MKALDFDQIGNPETGELAPRSVTLSCPSCQSNCLPFLGTPTLKRTYWKLTMKYLEPHQVYESKCSHCKKRYEFEIYYPQ